MAAASVGSVVDVTQLLCRERAAAFGIAIESLAAVPNQRRWQGQPLRSTVLRVARCESLAGELTAFR